MKASSTPCPGCGATQAQVTVEFAQPVEIDREVMVIGTVTGASCDGCGALIEIPEGHTVTLLGEKVGENDG